MDYPTVGDQNSSLLDEPTTFLTNIWVFGICVNNSTGQRLDSYSQAVSSSMS